MYELSEACVVLLSWVVGLWWFLVLVMDGVDGGGWGGMG